MDHIYIKVKVCILCLCSENIYDYCGICKKTDTGEVEGSSLYFHKAENTYNIQWVGYSSTQYTYIRNNEAKFL